MTRKKKNLDLNMTKEAILSLFRKPATRKYPFVKAPVAESFRGKQIFDIVKCVGCGLCSKDCPAKAIEMVMVEGKKRPLFHLDKCVFCYQCADSCATNAIQSTGIFELACVDKNTLELRPEPVLNTQKSGNK
jgi:formate hydrogenlyase subunit 6/NADH:ubiquinone oxidoreductase subunit I